MAKIDDLLEVRYLPNHDQQGKFVLPVNEADQTFKDFIGSYGEIFYCGPGGSVPQLLENALRNSGVDVTGLRSCGRYKEQFFTLDAEVESMLRGAESQPASVGGKESHAKGSTSRKGGDKERAASQSHEWKSLLLGKQKPTGTTKEASSEQQSNQPVHEWKSLLLGKQKPTGTAKEGSSEQQSNQHTSNDQNQVQSQQERDVGEVDQQGAALANKKTWDAADYIREKEQGHQQQQGKSSSEIAKDRQRNLQQVMKNASAPSELRHGQSHHQSVNADKDRFVNEGGATASHGLNEQAKKISFNQSSQRQQQHEVRASSDHGLWVGQPGVAVKESLEAGVSLDAHGPAATPLQREGILKSNQRNEKPENSTNVFSWLEQKSGDKQGLEQVQNPMLINEADAAKSSLGAKQSQQTGAEPANTQQKVSEKTEFGHRLFASQGKSSNLDTQFPHHLSGSSVGHQESPALRASTVASTAKPEQSSFPPRMQSSNKPSGDQHGANSAQTSGQGETQQKTPVGASMDNNKPMSSATGKVPNNEILETSSSFVPGRQDASRPKTAGSEGPQSPMGLITTSKSINPGDQTGEGQDIQGGRSCSDRLSDHKSGLHRSSQQQQGMADKQSPMSLNAQNRSPPLGTQQQPPTAQGIHATNQSPNTAAADDDNERPIGVKDERTPLAMDRAMNPADQPGLGNLSHAAISKRLQDGLSNEDSSNSQGAQHMKQGGQRPSQAADEDESSISKKIQNAASWLFNKDKVMGQMEEDSNTKRRSGGFDPQKGAANPIRAGKSDEELAQDAKEQQEEGIGALGLETPASPYKKKESSTTKKSDEK
jgi:hypothetical protein